MNSYENKNGYNNFEMYISMMGFKVIGFTIEGTGDTKADISMYVMDEFDIKGSYESSSSLLKLNLVATSEVEDEEGNTNKQEIFSINVDGTEVVKNKEYDATSIKILEGLESIPEVDISDSAIIDEMSEEEKLVLDSILGLFGNNSNNDSEYEETY